MDLMKQISAARSQRDAAVKEARTLLELADAEKRELTADELTKWNDLHAQTDQHAQTIAMLEKQAEAERTRAGHVVSDNPRTEIKLRYKSLKGFANEETAYRSGMWARAVCFGDSSARAWCGENGIETRVGSAGVFTKGGALVPVEMSQAIIDLREQYGAARRLVRVIPMGAESVLIPRRTGGVTAYFVGENIEVTASDKSWDQVQLVAKKLGALSKLSTEYAEDATIDVAADLADEMAYAFAVKEDDCWLNGDGTSTYGGIWGLRAKIIDGTHTAGAIDGASGHDTFAEMDADDLLNVIGALPVYAENMAKWLVSKRGKTLMMDALTTAAGGNNTVTLSGKPAAAYLGDEIVVSQAMPTVVTDLSDVVMALYGDFAKATTMGDRRGFNVVILRERFAELDQIGVMATERFDIVNHDLGSTTAAGPVVALIGE